MSPPDKNGGDVMGDSARARAASDGTAISFASLQGFGDVRGTGVATEYMSVRTGATASGGNGWSTHAITPPQAPLTFAGALQAQDPIWEGEFSADLTHGVFRAWSPVTDAPNVANAENLYMRDDLRTPGAGDYQLATDCPMCGSSLPSLPSLPFALRRPFLAGASADLGHVVFESTLQLTPDSTADGVSVFNLYEWDHGVVRLAGVLPDSVCGTPPCVPGTSIAGQGAAFGSVNQYTPRVISADGSRIFFTADPSGSCSSGGRCGALYMREDGTSTVQLNASEKMVADPAQPATYWTASADGSRVFFTTGEQLTSDDDNSSVDLYMYDVNAPAGAHLARLSVDHAPADPPGDVRGAIGTSDDGHYVYFISFGQLAAGGPPINFPGVFVWHDGAVSYVGELTDATDYTDMDLPLNWTLSPLQARVSPDGRSILFGSHSGVGLLSARGGTDFDHGNCGQQQCEEIYLYRAASGGQPDSLVCASCDRSGNAPAADAAVSVRVGQGGALTTWHLPHALADDGSRVFFNTGSPLVPDDSNGKVDPYEWEAKGVGDCALDEGCISLLSSGKDAADSFFMDASTSGDDVFFTTRQRLVGWDIDQNYDLYDARVGGGLPEPAASPPACEDNGCQDPAGLAPSALLPGSAVAEGPGDAPGVVTPKAKTKPKPKAKPKPCKRGFVRKRVKGKARCVKKPKARRAAHARRRGRAHTSATTATAGGAR